MACVGENKIIQEAVPPTPIYPMGEIVPGMLAVPAVQGRRGRDAQAAVVVYQPFKEHEPRSMRERILECKNEPQMIRDLIAQWVETHQCTHRDIGILCQAILSPTVWRKTRREAVWPAKEGVDWTDENRQGARDRLYNAIQTALRPTTLDWTKVYAIQQRADERVGDFKHHLIQGF